MDKQIKVTYVLSKEGQKKSIMAGGDGKSTQTIFVPVTEKLVKLSEVDRDGNLTIDASSVPEYQYKEESVLIDTVTCKKITAVRKGLLRRHLTFDEPQSIEGILKKIDMTEVIKNMEDQIPTLNQELEEDFKVRKEAYLNKQAEVLAKRQLEIKEKESYESDRSEWILSHGSQYLKDCLELDVKANLEYVVERAALEFPGYVVDYSQNSSWGDRVSPSQESLAELKKLRSNNIDSEIVWLYYAPKVRCTDDLDDEGYEQCEAVVIKNYLGSYTLVKVFNI